MATLASVNVGLPAEVSWKDRIVYTGAWKTPVEGPRMVRRLNIDGDGQGDLGGHGGENRAVLVYQLDSYRHWMTELDRDLRPGDFGENFTVDGLPDDEVCIGDRYQIGETLLEVTQPRVTCYRLGLRLDEPRMAALLVSHRRPGFYCRVLREGHVQAGDDIVKVADGPEGVTVAEIDALLYLPGHPRAGLERALRIDALSPGWKTSLRALLDDAGENAAAAGNRGLTGTSAGLPAWSGWRTLRVVEVEREGLEVTSFTLADAQPLPEWQAGQSIAVRVPDDGGTGSLIRNYSLSNDPTSGRYRIGVKRESQGAVSRWIHEHVAVGAALDIAAPRGTFVLGTDTGPVILISAGVGVTPMLSMLHALAAAHRDRSVWWLHGARDGARQAFAAEVRDLLKTLPRSVSRVYFSAPAESDRIGVDYDEPGRISVDALRRLDLPVDASVFICGPEAFMRDVGEALVECGIDATKINTEIFGAHTALTPGLIPTATVAPHPPRGPVGAGPMVQFARSALSAPWGTGYGSMLEFAEACDVPTRWSCRTGVCHNCETALLAGDVDYTLEPLDPPAAGNVLLCVSTPRNNVVIDL
ncbi:MOSC domain-containing protein [Mycolicibacterium fluoranthenivorans]|uniref:nitric oxide dioxygenase n=1 Tax=Mycolicibacterium fluoranthenivorans TaxID=258505 RepID=A0A7G8P8H1_9MYCO|nr:MOSC and FAD-binding oxidoreductase domain-containing protein [Mycolicibacterium fluoranthenivorans]QNJ90637.1 MOSC domain-containing protein [Mycolicibacterium fluoranthenivorans]